jgi:hypothetical protein
MKAILYHAVIGILITNVDTWGFFVPGFVPH